MEYKYPEKYKDPETGRMTTFVKEYDHYALYYHPAGYHITATPLELHLIQEVNKEQHLQSTDNINDILNKIDKNRGVN